MTNFDFDAFRRSKSRSLEELNKLAAEATGKSKSYSDDGYWKPTVDKTGNARAVLRFLPNPAGGAPWVQVIKHWFQHPVTGLKYIDLSRKTIDWDEPDPVSEWLDTQYAKGDAGKKEIDRIGAKRKKKFVSNILVVDDPDNTTNNGKVFLFEYGVKILDKLQGAMAPEFADIDPVNPFDLFEGADFKFRQKKDGGWPDYSASTVAQAGPIRSAEGKVYSEDQLREVFEQLTDLSTLVSPDKFKSYEDLKRKFDRVMGISAAAMTNEPVRPQAPIQADEDEDEDEDRFFQNEDPVGEDDPLAHFRKIANGGA